MCTGRFKKAGLGVAGIACALTMLAPVAHAQLRGPDDADVCQSFIPATESAGHIPRGLLTAIGVVESGRVNERTGRVEPWPWTINVAGVGHMFASKADAIDAVNKARADGVQSIDVGCMQINLLHHPNAFASLDQAFDPQANVTYAASFLSRLFTEIGAWPDAAAAYHSRTPGLADPYRQNVMARWQGSARYATATAAPDDANRLPALRSRLIEIAADGDALAAAGVLPSSREPAVRAAAGSAPRRGDRQMAAAGPAMSSPRLHERSGL